MTVADERAEAALEAGLSALLPGSVVIGEELTARDPAVLDAIDNHVGSMWIVDPVDGTQNFADGKTCFAMIVAALLLPTPGAPEINTDFMGLSLPLISGPLRWTSSQVVRNLRSSAILAPLPMS